jgi:uncharacterized protein YcnI
MKTKVSIVVLLAVAAMTSLSAHIMVSPPQSKAGASQKYELRVHNEGKVAATGVDLEIPDGVTITDVSKPAAGAFTTKTTGSRTTSIAWQIDVQPSKYVALLFTAKNPDGAVDLHWNIREHLADGSFVDWSDKPGSKEKGSVTKLAATAVADAAPAGAAERTWTGTVSDKMCGADHKKMGGKLSDADCTLACTKGGTPYVLVADGKAYELAGHEADLKTHAGHTVTVTGELKGDVIRVAKIDMAKSAK